MKRGKRQVIEKANLFDEEPTGSTVTHTSHNSNVFAGDASLTNDKLEHDQPIYANKQIKKQVNIQQADHQIREPVHENKSHTREAASGQNSGAGNDERKKRLDMLKNKYLKSGPSTVQHNEESIKQQPKTYSSSVVEPKNHNIENSSSALMQAFDDRRKVKQGESPASSNTLKKTENEPISKPTQTSSTRKPLPHPPAGNRGRQPPPPPMPSSKPLQGHTQPQQQSKIQISTEHQEQQEHGSKSPQETKSSALKKVPSFPRPPNSPTNPTLSSYSPHFSNIGYEKEDINFEQIVKHWLKGINYYINKNRPDMTDIVQAIAAQVAAGSSPFLRGIVKLFVLSNQARYTQQQINILTKEVLTRNELSPLAKLFISIKCGSAVLLQYCGPFLDNPTQLLPQIRELKSNFLPVQLAQLSKTLLSSEAPAPQTCLHHIAYLSPNSPALTENLLNHQFHSSANAALVLCQLKNNIQQNQCNMYFRLINRIVSDVTDQRVLEDIIGLIGNVTYASAYQIKKDTKLKIIEKIDRSANGTVTQIDQGRQYVDNQNELRKHAAEPNKIQSKDTDKQKGLGLNNFMGYFNQALKKITNQTPEREQPLAGQTSAVEEEPKETFSYDPVLKRYLINGKVPQDQYGNTVIDTEDSKNDDEKQKKKVPPPPPRLGGRKAQTKKQVTQQRVEATNDVQYEKQPVQVAPEEQPEMPKSAFPVPRVGLKGMANKKPKIQARYA